MSLGPLDIGVILVFVAAILALGCSAKVRESSALQFISAGRALTLPLFLATLVATWYGGILGIGESVQDFGFGTLLLMGCPYYLFALIYALWWAKRVRQVEQISIPERIARRFGKSAGLTAAGLVFLLGVPAAHVLMLGTLVQLLTGWPLAASCVIALIVGMGFLYKGGLLADARMSLLAFSMMYVGFAVIVGWCLVHYPFGATIAAIEPDYLRSWTGGNGPLMITSFFILGSWTLIDPGFHQRAASAKTPEIAQKGVFLAVLFWFLFDLMTISTGMYALSLLDQTVSDPLHIFPAFANQVLPDGLNAVFLCGLLGTILSAMVGYTLVSGASFGRDFVCRLIGSDEETSWTRIGLFVAGVLAVVVGLNVGSVVALWYSWAGAIVGALMIPTCLAFFSTRTPRAWVTTTAMTAGFAVGLWLMIWGQLNKNPLLLFTAPAQAFGYNLPDGLANQGFSLGTLLPGLVISGLVMLIGRAIGASDERRND